jgi:hypothetical protein
VPTVGISIDGMDETLRAFRGLDTDLRKEANAEIRAAARVAATELANELRAAAAAAATPVARRVAASIAVKSDRYPTVSIGGSKRVGRRGAPAAALVWGSEQGGRNFAAAGGGSYWIAPTVDRFQGSLAVPIFETALAAIVARYGLA